MLIGEYAHTLDDKKRLQLPSKFRKELGRGVIITRGLDKCLFMFSADAWKKIVEKMNTLSLGAHDTRGFNRFMLAGATEADIDSNGRILIPEYLKDFAGLKNKVVIAGVSDRAEIWEQKRWEAYTERIEAESDAMADKLGQIGII